MSFPGYPTILDAFRNGRRFPAIPQNPSALGPPNLLSPYMDSQAQGATAGLWSSPAIGTFPAGSFSQSPITSTSLPVQSYDNQVYRPADGSLIHALAPAAGTSASNIVAASFKQNPSGSTAASPAPPRNPAGPLTPLEIRAMQPPYNLGRDDLSNLRFQSFVRTMLKTGLKVGGLGLAAEATAPFKVLGPLAEGADAGHSLYEAIDLPKSLADDYQEALQNKLDAIDGEQQLQRDIKSGAAVGGGGVYVNSYQRDDE